MPRLPFTLLLALALIAGGCSKKTDPVGAATRFFEQIAAGKTHEAYTSAAFGFQTEQNEKVFAQTIKEMGLNEYASGQWEPAGTNGREAKVRVEVLTKS